MYKLILFYHTSHKNTIKKVNNKLLICKEN